MEPRNTEHTEERRRALQLVAKLYLAMPLGPKLGFGPKLSFRSELHLGEGLTMGSLGSYVAAKCNFARSPVPKCNLGTRESGGMAACSQ